MTRCVLYTREGQVIGFLCTGHAAYAEAGQDIVCAAVSVLTQTCVNTQIHLQFGELPEGTENRDANTLLSGMTEGLREIAAQYPNHFRLDTRAVSEWR